jgi:hypothetical protein
MISDDAKTICRILIRGFKMIVALLEAEVKGKSKTA